MAWEPNNLDLRANYDLGVEAGVALERERIIQAFKDSDSACADWAIAIVESV